MNKTKKRHLYLRDIFLITTSFAIYLFSGFSATAEEVDDGNLSKEQRMAVFLINAGVGNNDSIGTGFACEYKGAEYVATNLHVVDGLSSISVIPQGGGLIQLSGKIIFAEDADICFLGIKDKFQDYGIVPLHLMEDVHANTKPGDSIICLGNSLGGGVITTTKGTIKAYGQPRLEIESPVVNGNSGGPIIHTNSGKVVGLVTEAIINEVEFDKLSKAAKISENSEINEISYFGHRFDSVKVWKALPYVEFNKSAKKIEDAKLGLISTYKFFTDEDGWRQDRRLSSAWDRYSKFIDKADSINSNRVQVDVYLHSDGFVRRYSRAKGVGVSDDEYDKEKKMLIRAIEWKTLSEKKVLEELNPAGYLQNQSRIRLIEFSNALLDINSQL